MQLAGPDDVVFRCQGDLLVPTELAQGPWSSEHLHGGAVAAVLARAAEGFRGAVPMRVVRLTVDMMRATPMRPLRTVVAATRSGRRIQLLDIALHDQQVLVARAAALLIRVDEAGSEAARRHGANVATVQSRPGEFPGIDQAGLRLAPGFLHATDFERGPVGASGVVVAWTRLRCALVEGEEPSPLVRLAASADFTSGTASRLDYRRWLFINPDLSIHVEREPRGEWIAVEAQSSVGADGIGQSSAVLHDAEGPIARTQASMLVDRREA